MSQAQAIAEQAVENRSNCRIEGAVSFRPVSFRLAGMNVYYATLAFNAEELVLNSPLFGSYRFTVEQVRSIAIPDHDDNALVIEHVVADYPETILFYPKLFPEAADVLPILRQAGFCPKVPVEQPSPVRKGAALRLWAFTLALMLPCLGCYGFLQWTGWWFLQPLLYLLPTPLTFGLWYTLPRWKPIQWMFIKRGRFWREAHPNLLEVAMKFAAFFVVYWACFRGILGPLFGS